MRPERAMRSASSTTGSKRSEWLTDSATPRSRARAIMASHSATLSAMGFSTNTWQPRSMASSAMVAWLAGGVRT